VVTGCNGELCAPEPMGSSCIWLPEYDCLYLSTCEIMMTPDGQMSCGWVQNQEYLQCLQNIQDPADCDSDADCPPGTVCQTYCDENWCHTGCYPQDCECYPSHDPVCGVDGVTYENICLANCAGVEMAYPGPCNKEP
jgi:hypothetical protein